MELEESWDSSIGAGGITLTEGQLNALQAIVQLMLDPVQQVLVIEGPAGTGKSTLIQTFMARMEAIQKSIQLLDPDAKPMPVVLTATTNKAAEALRGIAKQSVFTIHSFLGLRVFTDYRTNKTTLSRTGGDKATGKLVVIDEASFIDSELLHFIFSETENCKFIFLGDPYQLLPVKSNRAPVFSGIFPTVELTEVKRQEGGNLLPALVSHTREIVKTGVWNPFPHTDDSIWHVPRDQFEDMILEEFRKPGHSNAKVLAWTNARVIDFNQGIRDALQGAPTLEAEDYAINNKYICVDRASVKTDQVVQIKEVQMECFHQGVLGNWIKLYETGETLFFLPKDQEEAKQAIAKMRANADPWNSNDLEETLSWIDLRAAYSCTVNKSQGSTYETVFIDLDDIGRCNIKTNTARMLYVAISRAKKRVVFTGEL